MKKNFLILINILILINSCSSLNSKNTTYIGNDGKNKKVIEKDYEIIKSGLSPVDEKVNVIKSNSKMSMKKYFTKDIDYKEEDIKKVENNNDYYLGNYKYNNFISNEKDNNINENEDVKVHFFETSINEKDIENIKKIYPSVKLNIKKELKKESSIHASNVITSFLDVDNSFVVSNKEKIKLKEMELTLNENNNYNANVSLKGIISMSYGYPESNLEMARLGKYSRYFDKRDKFYLKDGSQYFSNALQFKNYIYNNQLRVRSIGNSDFVLKNNFFNNTAQKSYQAMSPEMQKLARNDVILAKNIYSEHTSKRFTTLNEYKKNVYNILDDNKNTIKYYLPTSEDGKFDSTALLLRAFTLSSEGIIKTYLENKYSLGSSLSAPRISRAAYEVKKKFPFLSLNQVKQVLLTTAKRDSSGYLNNYVGWGILDLSKALKGPSDFNAGLIEEEKYYKGNIDKIFENYNLNTENYNTYFYVNIPKELESTFSNDITSGLEGDGNNKGYKVYNIKGRDGYEKAKEDSDDNEEIRDYEYKIPIVLDSEKNYYSNIKKAGLRKDGKGTLLLTGKQYYDTKTQVLDGKLILDNDSNSKYEIFENGIFELGKEREKGTINIFNDIHNDGTVKFNKNVNLLNYFSSKNSKTYININESKINANTFLVGGNLYINLTKATSLEEIKKSVIANKIDLNLEKLKNPFFKKIIFNENKRESIIFKEFFENEVKIGHLSKEKLRNIPSYDDNAQRFFESYNHLNESFRYKYYKSGEYKFNFVEEDSILYNLLNYHAEDVNVANNEIFTDNYGSIVLTELKQNNDIKDLNYDEILEKTKSKNLKLKFKSSYLRDILNDIKFTNKSSEMIGNKLFLNYSLNDNFTILAGFGYYNGFGKFEDNNSYKSNVYSLNLGSRYNYNNLFLTYNFLNNISFNKGHRRMQEEKVDYTLNSFLINNSIGIGYNIKINDYLSFIPHIDYTNIIYNILDFKEKSSEKNKAFLMDINNNKITKNNIKISLKGNFEYKNTIFDSRISFDYNLNPKTNLKYKLMNINYEGNIGNLKKYNFELDLKVKQKILNDSIIGINSILNTNNKFGISIFYEKNIKVVE